MSSFIKPENIAEEAARRQAELRARFQVEAKKRHTSRGKRRREYKKDATNRRAQSMSRKQAREYCIAEEVVGACTRCGTAKYVKDLEDHHRDGDPFNNDKDNLTLHCKKCHPKSDTEWRKEKDEGKSITDVRQFEQLGVVVVDNQGSVFIIAPNNSGKYITWEELMKSEEKL